MTLEFFLCHFENSPLVEEANVLSSILQEVALKADCDNFWIWILECSKIFTVRSCYYHLVKEHLSPSEDGGLKLALKGLWKSTIPSKVTLFGLRMLTNSLLICDLLLRRNVINSDEAAVCVFCRNRREDLLHLSQD